MNSDRSLWCVIGSIFGIISLSIILTGNLRINLPLFMTGMLSGQISLLIFSLQILFHFSEHSTVEREYDNSSQQSLDKGVNQ